MACDFLLSRTDALGDLHRLPARHGAHPVPASPARRSTGWSSRTPPRCSPAWPGWPGIHLAPATGNWPSSWTRWTFDAVLNLGHRDPQVITAARAAGVPDPGGPGPGPADLAGQPRALEGPHRHRPARGQQRPGFPAPWGFQGGCPGPAGPGRAPAELDQAAARTWPPGTTGRPVLGVVLRGSGAGAFPPRPGGSGPWRLRRRPAGAPWCSPRPRRARCPRGPARPHGPARPAARRCPGPAPARCTWPRPWACRCSASWACGPTTARTAGRPWARGSRCCSTPAPEADLAEGMDRLDPAAAAAPPGPGADDRARSPKRHLAALPPVRGRCRHAAADPAPAAQPGDRPAGGVGPGRHRGPGGRQRAGRRGAPGPGQARPLGHGRHPAPSPGRPVHPFPQVAAPGPGRLPGPGARADRGGREPGRVCSTPTAAPSGPPRAPSWRATMRSWPSAGPACRPCPTPTTPRARRSTCPREPYLCLMPGSTWPSKAWPREHFLALARKARLEGLGVAVLGTPGRAGDLRLRGPGRHPRPVRPDHPGAGRRLAPGRPGRPGQRFRPQPPGRRLRHPHPGPATAPPTPAAAPPGARAPWPCAWTASPAPPASRPDCAVAGHPCLAGIEPGPGLGQPLRAVPA